VVRVTAIGRVALGVLLAVAAPAALAAAISVHVDREPLVQNESFRLTFEADGPVDGDPDFSPLERDFDLIGRSRRSNISVINGRFARSTTWVLNLMPRRAGTFELPSIRFGADRSETLSVRVEPAAAGRGRDGEDLFLVVAAAPMDPYVQAQVLYTVQIWRTVELSDASLSEPQVPSGDAIVEPLGKDRHYHAERDGRRYAVIERRYAVYPQRSGPLTLEPLQFEGRVIKGNRSMLDPFGQDISTRRLRSETVNLQVRPAPDAAPAPAGGPWLPARQIELREVWSDDAERIRVGEALSRTIAVIADGLTAGQLPELAPPLPDGLKSYPDQPVLTDQSGSDGVIGVRQEKVAIVPASPGRYVLPAVALHWWDVNAEQARVARLPARPITVLPAAGAPPAPAAPAAPAGTADGNAAGTAPAPRRAPGPLTGPWPWIAASLALAWATTLALWWRRERRHRQPPAAAPVAVDRRTLQRTLAHAPPRRVQEALLAWAAQRWPASPPTTLRDLGRRLGGAAERELAALDAALYAPRPAALDRAALARAIEDAGAAPAAPQRGIRGDALEPLYRS